MRRVDPKHCPATAPITSAGATTGCRGAVQVALRIHNKSCGRIGAVLAPCEPVQHSLLSSLGEHVNHAAAISGVAGQVTAPKGRTVEDALCVGNNARVRTPSVRPARKCIERLELCLRRWTGDEPR